MRDRRHSQGTARIYVRRKSGGTLTLVKTHENVPEGEFTSWRYAGGYLYYSVPLKKNGKSSTEFWRFNPAKPKAERLWSTSNYSFAVDASGNILALGSSNAKFRKADGTVIDVNIPGNSSDFNGFNPVMLGGKIYLLGLKSGSVKAFAFDQNGNVNEIASASVSGNSRSSRIYNVGDSTVFAIVEESKYEQGEHFETIRHVLRLSGGSLVDILPAGKKILNNSTYDSVRSGRAALYAILGPNKDQGTGVYRAGATKFEPVLPASEANKLENIFHFDVLPGSPDKIAVAAKTKTGKHVVIELDANGNVLRRSPELDKEIVYVLFWQYRPCFFAKKN